MHTLMHISSRITNSTPGVCPVTFLFIYKSLVSFVESDIFIVLSLCLLESLSKYEFYLNCNILHN